MILQLSKLLVIASLAVMFIMSTLPTTTRASSPFYAGTWRLEELYDESDAPVTLPKGQTFVMSLTPAEDLNGDNKSSDFQISIQIGNTLNTRVKLEDPTTSPTNVEMKFVRSTMMMPPQELYKLEMFLTDAFPKMETMALEEPVLTLQGSAAKIVFTRNEEE